MCCIGLICLLEYECLCLLFHLLWYDVLVQYSFVCTCNSWTVSCCLLSCSFIVHTCIPIRCAHIYLSTYLSTDLSIYLDIHACKYMHAWMYVNVCISLCACIYIYVYIMYIYMYTLHKRGQLFFYKQGWIRSRGWSTSWTPLRQLWCSFGVLHELCVGGLGFWVALNTS